MTATTLTLADFLLARLAEDHAAADLVIRPYGDHAATNDAEWWTDERTWWRDHNLSSDETALLVRMTPQRVMADVAAKRKIVGLHADGSYDFAHGEIPEWADDCPTLRALASVYADHPDWREEWR